MPIRLQLVLDRGVEQGPGIQTPHEMEVLSHTIPRCNQKCNQNPGKVYCLLISLVLLFSSVEWCNEALLLLQKLADLEEKKEIVIFFVIVFRFLLPQLSIICRKLKITTMLKDPVIAII